jgi:glutathione S-transferase
MRQDASDQSSAREDLYTGLRTLLQRKDPGGPYFFGKQWTVVDMSLAPFVRRFYNLEKFRDFKDPEVGNGWEEYKAALLGESSDVESLSRLDVGTGQAERARPG